jgi:triphosphoribosyl-dephospho-CoA synthase
MLNSHTIRDCIIWACEREVSAPKPGNVNCYSGANNMETSDFLKSAHAIAPALSEPNIPVGKLILNAITATRTVVNCNTNLGIVLLFAPLCVAIHKCNDINMLSSELDSVLNELTIDDAINTYQAIRLAEAGGMGKSAQQDINDTPTVTLRQAMKMAKDHDTIAAQYLNNYREIFDIGLKNLTISINCGETVEWASAFAYLYLLRDIPDSLIARKKGIELSQQIGVEANNILRKTLNNNTLSNFEADVIRWDKELKKKGLNPGTSADMTAATLLVYAFQSALS